MTCPILFNKIFLTASLERRQQPTGSIKVEWSPGGVVLTTTLVKEETFANFEEAERNKKIEKNGEAFSRILAKLGAVGILGGIGIFATDYFHRLNLDMLRIGLSSLIIGQGLLSISKKSFHWHEPIVRDGLAERQLEEIKRTNKL